MAAENANIVAGMTVVLSTASPASQILSFAGGPVSNTASFTITSDNVGETETITLTSGAATVDGSNSIKAAIEGKPTLPRTP